ncbi:hypothetical protein IscW_ISCW004768 [Ixodes scapularis]|uniref:Uncharacterized protein n=1 Tax=Ixodes scapularis TaxID=6945 RepID=B7PEN7_IXOSC|nr:hypothetical protein IscW_ISCW004768 [Ixodes scapularis]|eukprot:XP_002433659.1 hypothetical protein IscW_ISCW004768 [Ixodes scapularis]
MKETNSTQGRGIITRLANLTMLIGGHEQRRLSLPMSLWMFLLTKKTLSEAGKEYDLEFNPEAATSYDFSGKGAFAGYQQLMTDGPRFTLNIPNRHCSEQLIFYACLGPM